MIKLVMLTGFLGAGKTTLLTQVLDAYTDQKVGVIVNDFGELNIDAQTIGSDGIEMAELSNGSIFCACIKDKFVDSLIEMSYKDITYLFIEASGLADPANMAQILEGIQRKIKQSYDYRGSICIVDGDTFEDLYEVLPAITSQLEFCSVAMINKADLICEMQLKNILQRIHQINPAAETMITSYCQVDIKSLVDRIEQNPKASRDSSNTEASKPATFVVKGGEPVTAEQLHAFIDAMMPYAYRIKGFAITDRGVLKVDTVGSQKSLVPWKEAVRRTELLIISKVGFKMISYITKALNENVKGLLRL